MKSRAAVIDIGSNSIKALVASRIEATGKLDILMEKSLDARISAGIGEAVPVLLAEGIRSGVMAVVELLKSCRVHEPLDAIRIVATSAVRSATNGHDFVAAVHAATGHEVHTLSGLEEAEGIARGILGDPALPEFESFTAFDLGGGSLELMYFEGCQLKTYHSFELGSVRLMEMFFGDPSKPIPAAQQQACARHLHETLAQGSVPLKAPLVGCGGGLTVASRMLEGDPQAAERTGSVTPYFFSKSWFKTIKPLVVDASKEDRLRIPGIPESRADIFPIAILTCDVLMHLCGADGIHHTTHNLRFGIAHDILGIPH